MSSPNLEEIIDKFPEQRTTIKRLEAWLRTLPQKGEEFYTFEHLYAVLSPTSPEAFSLVLAELVRQGIMEKIIRVESPLHKGGIEDFPSLQDIPDEIYDWRSDRQLRVQPDHLIVLFRVHGK